MSKVTYEEVLDYLKGGNLFGELSNENLELIEELIEQHIPKTFEEIVTYWGSIGYEVHLDYEDKSIITSVAKEDMVIIFDHTDYLHFGQFVYGLSKKELHGINITTEYLESYNKPSNRDRQFISYYKLKWGYLGYQVINNNTTVTISKHNNVYEQKIEVSLEKGTVSLARVDKLSFDELSLLFNMIIDLKSLK